MDVWLDEANLWRAPFKVLRENWKDNTPSARNSGILMTMLRWRRWLDIASVLNNGISIEPTNKSTHLLTQWKANLHIEKKGLAQHWERCPDQGILTASKYNKGWRMAAIASDGTMTCTGRRKRVHLRPCRQVGLLHAHARTSDVPGTEQ